ncbi:efflux RND transporter periplasmic adaptor subunit [Gimesia panareensis]|uniref:efflux RND transporter periplasmic adaptor subunit n=1 Tax=Gimesia panareensis TaxID=2527978 RepID=UPI00118B9523|nr:efflux RND transporter periplasmic adaptor subunit [Gimesia panareensis]QDU51617.1 periplasmic multidrug efflux lipoprotein precursor [Gimesia panareensis]
MNSIQIGTWIIMTVAGLLVCSPLHALEMEGYTEPYRTIRVATDETGIIDEIFVREGQAVPEGAPLLRLNNEVHNALLAVAEQNMLAQGRLESARAEQELKQERLKILQSLRREGNARQEEVDRAQYESAVAKANVQTVQEDLVSRKLEYQKIKTQISRRTIRAPIAGVVSLLHKEQGEFVAPNSPETLTLVQLDQLLAYFTLTSQQAAQLHINDKIEITFKHNHSSTEGTIEYISPVTDAQSGTVLVKIRIDNQKGDFRSGERCTIQLES